MSPLRRVGFESSRGGEEKTWSLPTKLSRRLPKPSTARPGPGLRVGLRATESLVEAHVADEALEPRDKVLPGVRIPSPRVYQQKRRNSGGVSTPR
jgi:hypothetical protein